MVESRTAVEVDCITGEVTERPLTVEEIAELDAQAAQMELEQAEREAEAQRIADLKASAKTKLIAGEPLTAEEAETLVL